MRADPKAFKTQIEQREVNRKKLWEFAFVAPRQHRRILMAIALGAPRSQLIHCHKFNSAQVYRARKWAANLGIDAGCETAFTRPIAVNF